MEDQSPDGKFRQLDILPFLDGGALRDRQLQLRLPGGAAAGVSRSCDTLPPAISSSADTLLVHFQSDYSVAHNGFRLGGKAECKVEQLLELQM